MAAARRLGDEPDKHFIWLVSDAYDDRYPTNTLAEFTASLPGNALTLPGDSDEWAAALHSVHFPQMFNEVREDVTFAFFVEPLNVSTGGDLNETQLRVMRKYPAIEHWLREDNTQAHAQLPSAYVIWKHWAGGADDLSPRHLYYKLVLPKGRYASIEQVCQTIANTFDRALNDFRCGLSIRANSNTGCLEMKFIGWRGAVYTTSMYLPNLLHIPAYAIHPHTFNKAIHGFYGTAPWFRFGEKGKAEIVGTSAPRFRDVHAIYVYTDLIKPQVVGNIYAPLMAIVPVKAADSESYVVSEMKNPIYIPLSRLILNNVNVTLRTNRGELVPFAETNQLEVVLTVEITRIKK